MKKDKSKKKSNQGDKLFWVQCKYFVNKVNKITLYDYKYYFFTEKKDATAKAKELRSEPIYKASKKNKIRATECKYNTQIKTYNIRLVSLGTATDYYIFSGTLTELDKAYSQRISFTQELSVADGDKIKTILAGS